jgi:ParB-like chromosome segregation protein Spo0J
MVVELISISDLTPDPDNARAHEKGVPELMESLTQFGQVKPLVVWSKNVVIAGNGLLEAMTKMELTHAYIVRVPKSWTYDKARAFALVDNKTAELSEWKLPTLQSVRLDLDANGWSLEPFGFEALKLPNFTPTDIAQPRLDESVLHVCPSCGFNWHVNSKGLVVPA